MSVEASNNVMEVLRQDAYEYLLAIVISVCGGLAWTLLSRKRINAREIITSIVTSAFFGIICCLALKTYGVPMTIVFACSGVVGFLGGCGFISILMYLAEKTGLNIDQGLKEMRNDILDNHRTFETLGQLARDKKLSPEDYLRILNCDFEPLAILVAAGYITGHDCDCIMSDVRSLPKGSITNGE